jgi:hypothetical protein
LATGSPALRWQELYTSVYTKRERLLITERNAATRSKKLLPRIYNITKVIIVAQPCQRYRDVVRRVGLNRSSDEVL